MIASSIMKACTALLALTLGLASLPACSGDESTGTTGTSSTGATSTSTSATTGSGSGGSGGTSSTTGAGGAGGGVTSGTGSGTSSASASSSGAGGSGGMAAFALTSTAFSEGMVIPDKYTCAIPNLNGSPDLSWTVGPTGTLSYAVVLTDKSNAYIHWVIWDIPGGTTSLPASVQKKANPAVPAGSKQAKSYDNQTFGYLGPCPPNKHTYEFAVFALDVATLPNVTTATDRAQVKKEILNHDLGTTTLTGTYTPP